MYDDAYDDAKLSIRVRGCSTQVGEESQLLVEGSIRGCAEDGLEGAISKAGIYERRLGTRDVQMLAGRVRVGFWFAIVIGDRS